MRNIKKIAAAAASAAVLLGAVSGTELIRSYCYEIIQGDCNCSGSFDSLDVVVLQRWLVDAGADIDMYAADMNYDGRVNVMDLSLMKAALMESYNVYSDVTYTSKDEQYTMKFSITTDYFGESEVIVTWYDPDGDREKTDSFTVISGNPFTEEGEWLDDITFTNSSSYSLTWNESSVTVEFDDTVGTADVITKRAVVLDYPDRTRTLQTCTYDVNYPESPEITKVQLSAMCYGSLDRKCDIDESGNWLSVNTVGRVGAPLTIDVDGSIESYSVTLYYDDGLLSIPEEELVVLAFDEAAPFQVFIKVPDVAFDYEKNTITFTGDRDCDFILADGKRWS